jgi:outer membrane protein insertion porin family
MGVGLAMLLAGGPAEAAPPGVTIEAEAEAPVEGPAEPDEEPGPSELGEVVEGPVERSVEIVALQIRGRKQVSAQQVTEALDAENLLEGEQVFWPEDPRIDRAVQRLAATGYFDQVAIRLVPVSDRKDQASLVVDLHERGSLVVNEIHAANSELTPFSGGFNLMERNLAGTSVHLGAGFVVGTPARGVPDSRRQHAYKIYTELPAFAGTPVGAAASAYAILANEPFRVAGEDYDADPSNFDTVRYSRYGGVIGVTIPFTADLRLGIDFRFEAIDAQLPEAPTRTLPNGEIRALNLQLEDGLHYLSSAEFSFIWDERSRAAILGKGGHIRLDVQLSSPAIGSSYEYLRVLIGGGYSFRLPWGHWLTPSLWGGQVAGNAPRFELILPGDLSDWTPGRTMGLQYSTRWPIDTFKTGVNAYALARLGGRVDLEYGIPLFRRPRTSFVYGGYLFFSAGVFTLTGSRAERTERREAGELVAPIGFNANFGLKLDTNIGTFDISVGNILRRAPL